MILLSNELLRIIKKAALEAVDSSKPCAFLVGTVVSADPPAIKISPTITLSAEHIVLTRSISKYRAKLYTDGGSNEMIIDNSPEIGDKVILVRIQGGQKYLVLDKVVEN